MKSKKPKYSSRVRPLRLFLFTAAFGVIGILFIRFSSAANLEDPLGFADYCRLENNQTVIYGWAHDNDAPVGQYPQVRIRLSNGAGTTVNTDRSGFRDQAINDYLRYFNRPTSSVYGFRAVFSGLYKGTTYGISGTAYTYGAGVDQPLGINTSNQVDNQPANGFPNNQIPSACLANIPPPPKPVVSVNTNPSSVSYRGSTTVTWSATNSPTSCSNNFSGSTSGSGSFTATNLTANRTFTVTCSNAGGSGAGSRTVSVAAAPQDPPPGGDGGGGSGGSGGGSGGGGSGGPTGGTRTPTRNPGGSSRPTQPTTQPDTQAPSTPGNLSSNFEEGSVVLRWDSSTDNAAVTSYGVERSLDAANWEILSDTVDGSETSYSDSTVSFNTTYHYRVRAKDQAGNQSDYATTQVETGGFEPNAFPDQELILTSEDGIVTATIPAGTLPVPSICALQSSNYLAPSIKGYAAISGPHELICKQADGTRVINFAQDIKVVYNLSADQQKKYLQSMGYVYIDDWQPADATEPNSFVINDESNLVIMGQVKKTPLWQKILVVLGIIIAIVIVGLVGIRQFMLWKNRREIERLQQDYYHKERGY